MFDKWLNESYGKEDRNITYLVSRIDLLEKRITDLEYANKLALFKLTYNPLPLTYSINYVSIKEILLSVVEYLNLDIEYVPEKSSTVKLNKKGNTK